MAESHKSVFLQIDAFVFQTHVKIDFVERICDQFGHLGGVFHIDGPGQGAVVDVVLIAKGLLRSTLITIVLIDILVDDGDGLLISDAFSFLFAVEVQSEEDDEDHHQRYTHNYNNHRKITAQLQRVLVNFDPILQSWRFFRNIAKKAF